MKILKELFSKKEVNKGRQSEFDLTRGFAALVVIICHVGLYLGNNNDKILYVFSDIIGSEWGAPIFMALMGASMIYSKHKEPKELLKRGINLFIGGYLLSTFRTLIPHLLLGNIDYWSTIPYFFVVDILQFAGITFMFMSLLKKLKLKDYYILLISIFMVYLSQIINLNITNKYLAYFINLFIPVNELSCFPFLIWFFFPVFGLCFGNLLIHCKNEYKFYKILLPISLMGVLYVYYQFYILYPDYTNYYYGNNFYYMGVKNVLLTSCFITFAVSFWYFYSRKFNNKINNFLMFLSKNINIFYILSWIIISILIHYKAYYNYNFNSLWIVILIIIISATCYLLTKLIVNISNKKLKKMGENINMKKKFILITIIVLIILLFAIFFVYNNKFVEIADKVIIGTIYTGEKDDIVSAMAIKGEKIIFVGSKDKVNKYIGDNTEVTKYENGELISAALTDGHTHSIEYITASNDKLCKIPDGATAEECLDIIKKCIEEEPEKDFITASGWNNSAFGELGPTSDLLDTISGDKEILAVSSDGHSYWVNTKLLTKASITKDTKNPEGGAIMRYEDGTPSGCLKDTAEYLIDKVKPLKSEETYRQGILAADEFNISQGYLIRFQAGENEQYDLTKAPYIDYAEKLDQEGLLKTYTQASFIINNSEDAVDLVDKAIEYRDKTKGGNFEVSTVKIYLDGIIENEGAYLSESYSNIENYYGTPRWSGEEAIKRMSKVIAKANAAGMNVHFHVMGDQATSDALRAIELAASEIGIDKVKEARNSFVHLALVNDSDYIKMAKYNVIAVLNPWGFKDPSYYNDQVTFLGEERALKQYPYQSFIKSGVNISFGTDFGASFTYNSIESFHVLTTRTYKDDDASTLLNSNELLTRKQALDAMTKGASYQLHKEDEFGTIKVGKYANLTIFDKNILTIEDNGIMNTSIINTMFKGNWSN